LLVAPRSPAAPTGGLAAGEVGLELPVSPLGTTLRLVRDGLSRDTEGPSFREQLPDPGGSPCYFLIARRGPAALDSLPGPELCLRGATGTVVVRAGDPRVTGPSTSGDPPVYADWGATAERLVIDFEARETGLEELRVEYRNENGPVNTGITAAVKRATAQCGSGSAERGVIVMPHAASSLRPALSTAFRFRVHAGEHCRIELSDGFNMSYLQHFALYTGGAGGRAGPLNRATIAAFRFSLVAPAADPD
jgi:hypothetical protein